MQLVGCGAFHFFDDGVHRLERGLQVANPSQFSDHLGSVLPELRSVVRDTVASVDHVLRVLKQKLYHVE